MQDIIMQGNLNGFETVRKMGNDPEKSGHMLQRYGKIYFNIFWYTSPKTGWLGLVTSYIRNKNCILDPLGVGAGDGRNIILSSQWQIVGAATKRFYWTWVWPLVLFLHTDLCTRMQVCECVCVCAYLRRVFGCAVYIPACVHTKWPPSNNRGPLQSVFLSRKSLRNCL